MTPEELAALLAAPYSADPRYRDLHGGPLLAVLDTSCVRTALHYQLTHGSPPASLRSAQDGSIRLFMEYDTLVETQRKLPKFAEQFGVPVAELKRIINGWLPDINVAKVPPGLRQLDQRALAVRSCDPDDYPAAALAALLSPCILLTHNHKDFGALGVRTADQAKDAVLAAIELRFGEFQFQAMVTLPATPVRAAVGAFTWASGKIGRRATWTIVGILVVGLVILYLKQPEERKEKIKEAAVKLGKSYVNEMTTTATNVQLAHAQLRASVVPGPQDRSSTSAILRELAVSGESLSAQQVAEALNDGVRPSVPTVRAFLRANTTTLFAEVRRGGFVLGRHCTLPLGSRTRRANGLGSSKAGSSQPGPVSLR